jgi:hypothetical protein
MRIVVWNMSHWSRTEEQRRLGWSVLRDELAADVALLQETAPPEPYADRAVYRPIGGHRPWGSAVVGFTVDVEAVYRAEGRANAEARSILDTHPGTVAVATAEVNGAPLTFVSVYGLIDDGYADTTVNRQLSDLTPLFDDPRLEGRIVLAGDLNITTQWTGEQAHYADWEAATLQRIRIRGFGLIDCLGLHREGGPLQGCGCADGDRCRHIPHAGPPLFQPALAERLSVRLSRAGQRCAAVVGARRQRRGPSPRRSLPRRSRTWRYERE